MTTEQRLDRLTGIVDALAASVVAHDNQIENLIKLADKQQVETIRIGQQIENLWRQLRHI